MMSFRAWVGCMSAIAVMSLAPTGAVAWTTQSPPSGGTGGSCSFGSLTMNAGTTWVPGFKVGTEKDGDTRYVYTVYSPSSPPGGLTPSDSTFAIHFDQFGIHCQTPLEDLCQLMELCAFQNPLNTPIPVDSGTATLYLEGGVLHVDIVQ